MGEEVKQTYYTRAQRQEYRRKVQLCLDVFETMLAQSSFEFDRPLTGMEIECNLVDQHYQPAMTNQDVLASIADPAYQTELGAYNIEFNVPPRPLPGQSALELEEEVRVSLNAAETKANKIGAHIVMVGILPTLMPEHLAGEWMSESTRYQALNDSIFTARGEDILIDIDGPERLSMHTATIAPESACTSMQLHLQVTPAEFANNWNAAQIFAGPQLALGANSPYFFGHQLWAETRIELFTQATDTRPEELKSQGVRPRVWFGERWITSIFDLFEENVRYFPSLLPELSDEDPQAELAEGRTPRLPELRLHNGTVYRWNRACYGVMDGVAHLRIENRVMPAGPTVLDEMANGALWFGAMAELGARGEDVTRKIEFDQAGANFYSAAREGLGAHFTWLDGEDLTASHLILDRLLPLAEAGLRRQGIIEDDIKRYLGVVEARVKSGRTGARWMLSSWNALKDKATSGERSNALVAATLQRQQTGRPVAEWERARLDESEAGRGSYQQVDQYMTTDLFTVHASDPIEMVVNLMSWERIRHVPVEDRNHRLIGLVTYRSVLRFLAGGGSMHDTPVSAIMRGDVLSVTPEAATLHAIALMRRYRYGCLPVVQDGRLVGILTEEDFMNVASKLLEQQLTGSGP